MSDADVLKEELSRELLPAFGNKRENALYKESI